MNRVKEVKKALGAEYMYQRFLSDREVTRLRRQIPLQCEDTIAASLTVGCMKINAVLFQEDGSLRLGYDVYVKDSPGSSEWICFDCPSDRASLKEQDMLAVLDRIVTENGLSYTECCFERLEG
ncbi:hypothetical protein, partial [Acutalibacter caecimuris]|uniref:hypothetical protein n=1 Tax=Acutalibacter caecimuris TaxID=3093657 RepID=UPI00345FA70B